MILNILSCLIHSTWFGLSISVLFSSCFRQRAALYSSGSMRPKQRDKQATGHPLQCLPFLWSLPQHIGLPNTGSCFWRLNSAAAGLGACSLGGYISGCFSHFLMSLLFYKLLRESLWHITVLSGHRRVFNTEEELSRFCWIELNCKSMKKIFRRSFEKVRIMASGVRMELGTILEYRAVREDQLYRGTGVYNSSGYQESKVNGRQILRTYGPPCPPLNSFKYIPWEA